MLSTGSSALDDLVGGVRVGDNLVFVSDSAAPLEAIGRAYAAAVPHPRSLVIAATEGRALRAAPDDAVVLDLREGPFEAARLITDLLVSDEQPGDGAAFLVDSLTGVQERSGPEAALEVFLAICPRLYRRGSTALWLLDAARHDQAFLDRIRDITQVVVRLYTLGDEFEAEVLAAAGRPSTMLGRRQRLRQEEGVLSAAGPVAASRDRLGELVRSQRITRGISQAELARRVGVTPSALSQVERGVRGLAAETLIRIWEALGVPFGPEDTLQRGYRVVRRSGHQDVEFGRGVAGCMLFDDPRVGRCWQITVAPDAGTGQPLFSHRSSESVVLQRGVLDLRISGHAETLHEGDSLVAPQALVESCHNPGGAPAVALWIVLP